MSSVTAARLRATPAAVARSVPAWAWLAGIVALSIVLRYGLGRRMVAPWIVVDELIYSELAKSFAESGRFAIRDVAVGAGYGVVYPILISPAYLLFDSVPDAYAAAKAINAILISLAALPAYFLARRVLPPTLSLVAAALAVSLPALLYAGTLMTENAFYPLFLSAVLALVLALERPTPLRSLALLAVIAIAFATRAQALVFVPAALTAPLLLVLVQRAGLRTLAAYRWLYAVHAGALALILAVQAVRGSSPRALLGAYGAAGDAGYDAREVARWLLYHVAELDLALGFVPFAATIVLASLVRRLERRQQVFLVGSLVLTAWLLVQVAAFASRHAHRVEERNLFYVAPLLLIALLVWIDRGLPRPRVATAVAAAATVALPAFLPFAQLVDVPAVSDTFGLLLWWDVHHSGVPIDRVWIAAVAAAALAVLLLVACPPRFAVVLPALLAGFFVVSTDAVEARVRQASLGALFQGITRPERDWVDRAVRRDGEVAAIWSGRLDVFSVIQNEFFSKSVGPVYTVGPPLPGGLPQTPLTQDRATGVFEDANGPVGARYALVDDSLPIAGEVRARDRQKGLSLVLVGGVLRAEHRVVGLYDDGWSGPRVVYTRYRCRGGTLTVQLDSDPNLFRRSQTVVARVGERTYRTTLPRAAEEVFWAIPLRRVRGGRCIVRFRVFPTAVPAAVRRGSTDTRTLGTHFRRFAYDP